MTEQERAQRKPIKSPLTGDTIALISVDGLLLRNQRRKCWEVYSLEKLVQMHEEIIKETDKAKQKNA